MFKCKKLAIVTALAVVISAVVSPASVTANSDGTALKAAYDAAQQKVTTTKAAYDSALATANTKSAAVTNLKADYDTAVARKSKGSYGFFESLGATNATNALTTCKYKDCIKLGDEKDATSLTNMAASFKWMKRLNEIRKSVGLNELKVTSTLMAYAQADGDYSDTVVAHAQQFIVGENIAWNYGSDPYLQWYDEEKAIFDKAAAELGQTTPLTGAAAYEYYSNNKTEIEAKAGGYSEIGHYLNDINTDYTVTGFSVTTRGTMNKWNTYTQVFYFSSSETTYTVDQYESLFNNYITTMNNTITSYNAAVAENDTAQAALATAKAAYDTAVNECETAKAAYDKWKNSSGKTDSSKTTQKTSDKTTTQTTYESSQQEAAVTIFVVGKAKYKIKNSGAVIYVAPTDKKITSVKIPATVTYAGTKYKVVEIAADALKDCKKLKKVTVGSNVAKIGDKAFSGTTSLKKITFKTKKLNKKNVAKSAFSKAGKGGNKKITIKAPSVFAKYYKKIVRR